MPSNSKLWCVQTKDGVHILGMMVVTILFATLGFLPPTLGGPWMKTQLFAQGFISENKGLFKHGGLICFGNFSQISTCLVQMMWLWIALVQMT